MRVFTALITTVFGLFFWNLALASVTIEKTGLQTVYRVAGVPERCRLYVGDGGHRYYKEDVWPFMHQAFEQWVG